MLAILIPLQDLFYSIYNPKDNNKFTIRFNGELINAGMQYLLKSSKAKLFILMSQGKKEHVILAQNKNILK